MKTKAKYRFIDFIRPDGYWPWPYTLEQAFGVFAWMLRTGAPYFDQGTWGRHNVYGLLSCKPTCVNFSEVDPIRSVADLQQRFHYAILSGHVGPNLQKWRKKHRITPDGESIVSFPHHGWQGWGTCEADVKQGIDGLLNAKGRLRVQLNEFHAKARSICRVELQWRGTYRFVLKFGYDGSEWGHCLSRQLPGEGFYTAFQRAHRRLGDLVDGKPTERVYA